MGCQVHSLCFNIEWIFHRRRRKDEGRKNVDFKAQANVIFSIYTMDYLLPILK